MQLAGAILLLVFLSLIAGMALCAGCDREWFEQLHVLMRQLAPVMEAAGLVQKSGTGRRKA